MRNLKLTALALIAGFLTRDQVVSPSLQARLEGQVLIEPGKAIHPYVTVRLANPSVAGRSIELIRFDVPRRTGTPAAAAMKSAPPSQVQRILIQGAVHGNELQTARFVRWLANRFATGKSRLNKIADRTLAIDFIPVVNPDGHHRRHRANGRGVNLNRNFPMHWGVTRENPGSHSFSEPETRNIQSLFQERRYDVAIDIHGYTNWIVMPSPPAPEAGAAERARYQQLLLRLKEAKAILPGYELKNPLQLGDGGAFEDWAFWGEKADALCLELASESRFISVQAPGSKPRVLDTFDRYEEFLARFIDKAPVNGVLSHH